MAVFKHSNQHGFLMIEAIIGIAITAVFCLTFLAIVTYGLKANTWNIERLKAELYLTELIEIAKDLEQSNWETLVSDDCSIDTPCHFEANSIDGENVWVPLDGSEKLEDGTYERSVFVTKVDENRLELQAEITWQHRGEERTMNLETILYNYENV